MNSKDFRRIISLPDEMPCEELIAEFQKLLSQPKHTSSESAELLLKAYFELSERQWHTYKLLDADLARELDSTLITLWDRGSLESTELLLGIVGRLGLTKTFKLIEAGLSEDLPQNIKDEILGAIAEFGNSIANPYADMPENV